MSSVESNNVRRRYNYRRRHTLSRQYNRHPYGLPRSSWNPTLQSKFDEYERWRTARLNPDRPSTLRQRPTTFEKSVPEFEAYFGYLVRIRHENPDCLRFAHITDSDRVRAFATWHAETRASGLSRYTEKIVGTFYRIARYYLNSPAEQWSQLDRLRRVIRPDTERDRRSLRVSLAGHTGANRRNRVSRPQDAATRKD